ncbi:carboxypeptidase-like regulatory domain-containing protein [Nostoc sp.]|uniref:carboxypeptidase-like regulatory domain-containing protein n=1 Tax=Nostoc sp. TaxID=1180 RepID=UPI002FF7B1B7
MMKIVAPDMIEQIALVTGKILHEGTGKPVNGTVKITVQESPVIDKSLSDGTFVLSGRPELLFPELSLKDYQLHLNIKAISPQFGQGLAEKSLTVTIPKGWNFEQPISQELPTSTSTILVLLSAEPVFIRGYVFDIDNPGMGIPNATVKIQQGSNTFTTLTSADVKSKGRYSFPDTGDPTKLQAFTITATNPATISCSATGFKSILDRPLAIDFERSLHEEYFYLVRS